MKSKFVENGYYWQMVDANYKVVAYSLREENTNELKLICPCKATINKLKDDLNEYYLGKIWEYVQVSS